MFPQLNMRTLARMEFGELLDLACNDVAAALAEVGIEPGWVTGDRIRQAPAGSALGEVLAPGEPRRIQAFQNLIVGTLAERAFLDDHLRQLESEGFELADLHETGENRDYAVRRDGLELPINVKVASTRFNTALKVVALDPDDCVPISAYKAIGACERVPDLVYVDLVDFTLRGKVDSFMDALDGSLSIGWELLSRYASTGSRRAQDRYVAHLFGLRAGGLKPLAPEVTSYRVISAQRVLAIMREAPRRVPGLGVKGAGTGGFSAEVNVHISVADEMRSWNEVADRLTAGGIAPLLKEIRRTVSATVPAPLL